MNSRIRHKLRTAASLAALVFVCAATTPAFGDGKVFPAVAFPTEVKIPDQTALLIWTNGVERLVIETRFVGEGSNFAWVVPLPSRPEIEPATTGLFTTLRYGLAPDLVHGAGPWCGISLFATGLLWLLLTVRRDRPRSGLDLLACLVTAGGFAAMLPHEPMAIIGSPMLFLLLLLAANRVRGGREQVYAFLLVVLLVMVMSAIFLPALGGAKGAAATGKDGVEILDQTRAGIYDTTTIAAKEPGTLFEWLNENGFATPTNAKPVVESLVRDGWVFVAAKIRRDTNNTGLTTPHPLSFTFRTSQPVYPLRLTGVGGGPLSVDLFVAGTERAAVKGFRTTDCRRLETSANGGWQRRSNGKLNHPQLVAWAGAGAVLTHLEGHLTATDMQRDAEVTWRDFRDVRTRLYSKQGAALTVVDWVVPVVCVFLVVLGLLHYRKAIPGRRALIGCVLAMVAGAAVGLGIYGVLPKTAVRLQRLPGLMARIQLNDMAALVQIEMPTNAPAGINEVRAGIKKYFAGVDSRRCENMLLGGSIREEDSPGNYTLRETPDGVEIIGYDTTGAAISLGVVPKAR